MSTGFNECTWVNRVLQKKQALQGYTGFTRKYRVYKGKTGFTGYGRVNG